MKLHSLMRAAVIVSPALIGVWIVAAHPAEVQSIGGNTTQPIPDALIVIVGFFLTWLARYLQNSISSTRATAQEAKKVADDTPSKSEFETLKETVNKQAGELARLGNELTIVQSDYRAVVLERDNERRSNQVLRSELEDQVTLNSKVKAELEESRKTVADMGHRMDEQDERYSALEKRLLTMDGANQLAEKIISLIESARQTQVKAAPEPEANPT